MLVVHNNQQVTEWGSGSIVSELQYRGDVIIVFDPSKTNMAMICGTPDGTILDVYEFSGNNRRKGPAMDTTLYCMQFRDFLRMYLAKAHLMMVVVEQAITYRGEKQSHVSNMVLTEVRSNLLNFFREMYGVKVIELNNWSWKHSILPEGYRSLVEKGNAKGSKRWLNDYIPTSPFGKYFESDVSDCFCMYLYIIKTYCKDFVVQCNRAELCEFKYEWLYVPIDSALARDKRSFPYNDRFTLQDNINFYLNRSTSKFVLKVPVEVLDIASIPKHTLMFSYENMEDKEVACIVWRV